MWGEAWGREEEGGKEGREEEGGDRGYLWGEVEVVGRREWG